MIFRQLFDAESGAYTYLLAHDQYAILIDPVLEKIERDLQLLSGLDLRLLICLETHTHADRITGSGQLRAKTGCKIVAPAGAEIASADWELQDGQLLHLGGIELEAIATPGHTAHHMAYYWQQQQRVFTGDALLIRGCGRTDFPSSNAGQLYDSVTQHLFRLPDETLVSPAHDYHGKFASTIGEEKHWNPHFVQLDCPGYQLRNRLEFIELMSHMKLKIPTTIMEAVPRIQYDRRLACSIKGARDHIYLT